MAERDTLAAFADRPLLLAPAGTRDLLTRPTERIASALEISPEGLAVIGISGPLVTRQNWWRGYDAIEAELQAALSAPEVREIVLHLDTPGGMANAFDLADQIYAARGSKPMTALVDEMALSAGYLLASACDRVILGRTGSVGSVGVITMHVDQSRMLDKAGLVVSEIIAGLRKADLSPFQPLSDAARERLQAEVDRLYALLVETVARNRGLSTKSVRDQQAGVFHGPTAIAAGLADDLFSFKGGHRAA